MTVLPALNVPEGDEEALRLQLSAVPEASKFHLDVADGTMTDNRSWSDAARFRELAGDREVQVHLMVVEPEKVIREWLEIGAVEVIVHLDPMVGAEGEAVVVRLASLRDLCHAAGAKLIVAGAKGIPARSLVAHRAYADAFLVLGVTPGHSAQSLSGESLETLSAIREAFEDVPIWFDGGVNADTIFQIREAGATSAVAASAIFNAPDPAAALTALQFV